MEGLKSDEMGLLFLIFRSYLRKQKKNPTSAANPIIGTATIRAILTFPRCPLKKLPEETVSVRLLDPISVELFGGEVGRLLEEGPLVDDEPELPGLDELDPELDPELNDPGTLVVLIEELEGVDPEELVTPYGELMGADARELADDVVDFVGSVDVKLGTEIVDETTGGVVEEGAFTGLVTVEPKMVSIPRSVAAHATGMPSFQTVDIGLGVTVCKRYPAGSVSALSVRMKTFVKGLVAMLEQTWGH